MEMAHCLVGSWLFERKWARRGLEEIRKGFSNLDHPHRHWLVQQFDALSPFSSVLEISCGYGPNLVHLARRFLTAQCMGIDINPLSVQEGNALLAQLDIDRVRLRVGKQMISRIFLMRAWILSLRTLCCFISVQTKSGELSAR
jgi:SAM-dependent methyltransferase